MAKGLAVRARAQVGRGKSAQGFYARRLRFGDLAFDIGANVGTHTAAMLKRGARVIALEPQADLARRLQRDFPSATVVAAGVSDRPGQGTLVKASASDVVATLNPASLGDPLLRPLLPGGFGVAEETIRLTTLDHLIAEFGLPTLIKIDTEGFEDKVLAGLGEPVEHILFEVHAWLQDVAEQAFARIDALGFYRYRVMPHGEIGETWELGPSVKADAILADLPALADVYARRTGSS
jgi:FkbM family methyltransferase